MVSTSFFGVLCNPEIVDLIAAEANPRDPHSVIRTLSMALPLKAVIFATNQTRHWRTILADGGASMSDVHNVRRQLARFSAGGRSAELRLRLTGFGWNTAGILHAYGLLNAIVAQQVVEITIDFTPPGSAGGWGALASPRHGGHYLADTTCEAVNSVLRIFDFPMPRVKVVRLTTGDGVGWPHSHSDDYILRRFLRRAPRLRVLDLDTVMPLHAVRLSSYPDLVRLETRIPVPASVLLPLAIACPNLQHLLIFLENDGRICTSPVFPCLHTIAAPSDALLARIGSITHTPVLRKILLEECSLQPVTISAMEETVMRERVPMAFGFAGRVQVTARLVDLLLAAVDGSVARGNPRPTLIFNALDVDEIRSFAQDILQRNPLRVVHIVTVSECDLTGAAALMFMSAVVQVICPGGELRFIGCRSLAFYPESNDPLIGDEWRQAVEAARDVVEDAGVRLSIA